MARRRHTPEQNIRKLREADWMLGEGRKLAEVARHLEVSEQTYHRWRKQFGGTKADDAKRVPRHDKSRESRSGRASRRRSPRARLRNHEYGIAGVWRCRTLRTRPRGVTTTAPSTNPLAHEARVLKIRP